MLTPFSISEPLGFGTKNLKNATDYTNELRLALPEFKIQCLHGRLKTKEKDEIMKSFADGDTSILVSTTVIEVGINVPNASLMIVENAERFGLSQLHQLRGRVGRGKRKSYCVLVSDSKSDVSIRRLETICSTYDGYEIAESDLMLRGPGDFFLTKSSDNFRQSGGFEFRFANLCDNPKLFEAAFSAAKSVVSIDPTLSHPDNLSLKSKLESLIDNNSSYIS